MSDYGLCVHSDMIHCFSYHLSAGRINIAKELTRLPSGALVLRNSMSHGYGYHLKPLSCGVVIYAPNYVVASRTESGVMYDGLCWGGVKAMEDPFYGAEREFHEEVASSNIDLSKLTRIGPLTLKYSTFYGYIGQDENYSFSPGENRVIEKGHNFVFRTDPGILIAYILHHVYKDVKSSIWASTRIKYHGAKHCWEIRIPVPIRALRIVGSENYNKI